MTTTLVRKNVTLGEHRTSLRLEREFWNALDDICQRENLTSRAICNAVEAHRGTASRTSAVRSFVVGYFRYAAAPEIDLNPALARMLATARRQSPE
jgi:predicted DNA-binding ribbon-helix-helix protein